jgi:hypothetical protein
VRHAIGRIQLSTFFRFKKTLVVDFDQSYLIAHLVQKFCANSKIDKLLLKYL